MLDKEALILRIHAISSYTERLTAEKKKRNLHPEVHQHTNPLPAIPTAEKAENSKKGVRYEYCRKLES